MKRVNLYLTALLLAITATSATAQEGTRDPLKQPFSSESIWNMPIGDEAEYIDAHLVVPTKGMVNIDEDYIFMTPDEPLLDVHFNLTGWNRQRNRCVLEEDETYTMVSLPIPRDFIISPDNWDGRVPNAGFAVLMKDKRYIYQGQPYAHCTEDGPASIKVACNKDPWTISGYADIYGDGYYGAHGGSHLSAIGGALRVHELTPTSGPITHALKVNVWTAMNLYLDKDSGVGYRWPAISHDGNAANPTVGKGYGTIRPEDIPLVKECMMGALLALKPDFDISKLRTEPAKILAQAFMDYGAYIVDGTGWDVFALITEWGPDGRFVDEFEKNWGFKFKDASGGKKWTPWAKDIRDIYENLHVVNNNTAQTIGGPGKRRVPMAAPLKMIE